jgi:ribosomal protein S18 acetylase RimI-like enzyme
MTSSSTVPCDILSWDSNFFNLRIARIRGDHLTRELAANVDRWARTHHVDCLYFLADVGDAATVQSARDSGYDLVDIRMTLSCHGSDLAKLHVPPPLSSVIIRSAELSDVPTLESLARRVHRDSRFFTDSRFPVRRAEELYSVWIKLECEGRATQVLVAASTENEPQGYISCHLDKERREGQIGLMGVAEKVRGQGIGKALIGAALNLFASWGTLEASVVTQGRNISAQRLYQRSGFRTRELQFWYHKWFTDRSDKAAT